MSCFAVDRGLIHTFWEGGVCSAVETPTFLTSETRLDDAFSHFELCYAEVKIFIRDKLSSSFFLRKDTVPTFLFPSTSDTIVHVACKVGFKSSALTVVSGYVEPKSFVPDSFLTAFFVQAKAIFHHRR